MTVRMHDNLVGSDLHFFLSVENLLTLFVINTEVDNPFPPSRVICILEGFVFLLQILSVINVRWLRMSAGMVEAHVRFDKF